MNFEVTNEIINELKPFISQDNITINTDNSYNKRNYKSDYVTIDERNHVGFEVMEDEITVYFFTNHCHFTEYSQVYENKYEYIFQAKEFLKELLSYKLQHIEIYKGKKKYSEKDYILYPENRNPFSLGTIYHSLLRSLNPFLKKTEMQTIWHYDKNIGCFTEAIEVIMINEKCYIEILQKNNLYSFNIMKMYYDDYSGNYWAPANTISSGIYDTKENAKKYAHETIKKII